MQKQPGSLSNSFRYLPVSSAVNPAVEHYSPALQPKAFPCDPVKQGLQTFTPFGD